MNTTTIDGAAIRRLRERRGWTQQDLADRLGLSSDTGRSYVSRLEAGQRTASGALLALLRRLVEDAEKLPGKSRKAGKGC